MSTEEINVTTEIYKREDVEEFVDLDDFDREEIVEEGDKGERVNYVVQRILLSPIQELSS